MTITTPALVLGKCQRCMTLQGHGTRVCRSCLSTKFTEETVPAIGIVLGTTIIRRPPAGSNADGAYAVVSLRLDAGPQYTGRLKSINEVCRPGDRVHATKTQDGILQFEKAME